jgi:hypothetical protein
MNVQDAQLLLKNQPKLKAALDGLIDLCIQKKVTSFLIDDHVDSVKELETPADTLKLIGNRFQINFDALIANEVLLSKAEALLAAPMPKTIPEALSFIDSFCEEIRNRNQDLLVRAFRIWFRKLRLNLSQSRV